ncbi:LysR substrate-binding domain-containing protein [Variovorax soli]|uniref:LysR substrate-binding domain-containing protein n=1 Tax=Variovorax soli TaxID=376815 RepID=UPI000838463A|nr:LysR substrate-binding domain-containing protein [Variovorax soli]
MEKKQLESNLQRSPSMPLRNRIDRLRIRHLRLLEQIAQTGSLSGAAQRLAVSQPGATKMLQEIEAALGTHLIERTSRGARLSVVGSAALGRLRIALGALDATVDALSAQPEIPLVRLGMIPVLAVSALPALAGLLDGSGRLPRLEIHEATVERLTGSLREGQLDCVVSTLDAQLKGMADLHITPLWEATLAIAAAPTHPLARKRKVPAQLLAQFRWALPPVGASGRTHIERWFIEAGLNPPQPFVEAHSFHTRLALVSSTAMLSVAPQAAVRHYAGTVREVSLERPMPKGSIFFVTRKEGVQLPEIALIQEALRKIASKYS